MNGTAAGMAPKRLPRDIKSGHCDPQKWSCFSIRTFSNERPWAVSLFRKGIHCVLKCLRRSIDRFEALLCSLKDMACAGLLENEIHGGGRGGGGKNNTFLSVSFPKAIRMPDERSQGPPCRMEACVARQSP
ncbi:hypothetical protein TNCT_645611 [Trichonephila clavata]|uniref:Uncharacterized protein n=1 Tax=Trichonephila clavata TaxID=2740835 RepID=A0A8X6LR87_TRICU|nr:hypothetical protein TNCT_645611 [Trichonephila clavata]